MLNCPKPFLVVLALLGAALSLAAAELYVAEPFTPSGSFTAQIEGPAVDAAGNVYAVSYARKPTIGRVTPDGEAEVFLEMPGGSLGNGIRFDPEGLMYVADYTNHNLLRIDPATKEVAVFAHEPRMNQPNDLTIGPQGDLYASDPNWDEGTGQLWRIDRQGQVTQLATGMGTTNGIELSPDGQTLYVNESRQRNVWTFRVKPDGTLTRKRLLIQFPDYGMDGMRCDVEGNLYITRHSKGTVVKLSPAGEILEEIDVLGANPTNICFGGPDGRTAYVTEAEQGRLVKFRVDAPGLAWQRWFDAGAVEPPYDLLITGGRLIDPKNGIEGPRDIAVANGKIARVAMSIPPGYAKRTVQADGLHVVPGLIDIHAHVYAGTGVKAIAGDQSVYPDGFSFRTGVTTMVDAGSSGWRNFPDFRQRIIDRAQTRILAFLNIGGVGMSPGENELDDMDPEAAVKMARKHDDLIVGFKVAHYNANDFADVDNAVKASKATGLPIMVDFGYTGGGRNLDVLLRDKLRQGDIYTHCYSGHRAEVLDDGRLNPAMVAGRERGILFDVGHGGGSFYWNIAVPAFEQGFPPDTISTDLHTGSMNAGMKDLPNVMSKVLDLGVPLSDVIGMATWHAAQAINRPELGHLSEDAVADITVLRLESGSFGFVDAAGARRDGARRFAVELTVSGGDIAWDQNGIAAQDWESFEYKKRERPPVR